MAVKGPNFSATVNYQNRYWCRLPIIFIWGFIARAYTKVMALVVNGTVAARILCCIPCARINPGAPSMYVMPTLGPNVYTYD